MNDTTYTHLRVKDDKSFESMKQWIERQRNTLDAIIAIQHHTHLRVDASFYQGPAIYFYGEPSDEEVEVARREAKEWVREMARAARRAGFELEKFANETEFGFRVKDTNLKFSAASELTCTQVPVLDEKGQPKVERVTTSRWVDVEVDQVVTERKCISLIAPEDY